MGYLLFDRPNPHGDHFYRSRRQPIRLIVLHITAGLEHVKAGADPSAEATANYAATTSRHVSWHVGVDADSIIELLPDWCTAWHVRGYNSPSLGLEMSKAHTVWQGMPRWWVEATLTNAATVCRWWVDRHRIPLRLLSRRDVDAGDAGFVYHSTLDPERRSDPGADFPIDWLFDLVRGERRDEMVSEGDRGAAVIALQQTANDLRQWANEDRERRGIRPLSVNKLLVDGIAGPVTMGVSRALLRMLDVPVGAGDPIPAEATAWMARWAARLQQRVGSFRRQEQLDQLAARVDALEPKNDGASGDDEGESEESWTG